MNDEFVFSWAENANGEMVHVDSVPKGTACNCFCPHCKEPLIARNKGEIRKHGFHIIVKIDNPTLRSVMKSYVIN